MGGLSFSSLFDGCLCGCDFGFELVAPGCVFFFLDREGADCFVHFVRFLRFFGDCVGVAGRFGL